MFCGALFCGADIADLVFGQGDDFADDIVAELIVLAVVIASIAVDVLAGGVVADLIDTHLGGCGFFFGGWWKGERFCGFGGVRGWNRYSAP